MSLSIGKEVAALQRMTANVYTAAIFEFATVERIIGQVAVTHAGKAVPS